MSSFIQTCSDKEKLLKIIGNNEHLFIDNDVYTLRNLIETKNDKFLNFFSLVCTQYSKHIRTCSVCKFWVY